MRKTNNKWYEGSVIYQIYPRSFQDSSGNGVGDLRGIISRLEYLADGSGLGVDAVWLSPFYPSPMADFGYDVSDYCDVDSVFGTLDDFDELLEAAHSRGIRILIDLVPNHTSIEHEWFKESRASRNNPKRDWYIWRDADEDGLPPNNWLSVFGGRAWTWDEITQQYYMHSFLSQQPDLNWENLQVRQAIADVMRFWLDRGVDGFRVDAVDHVGKAAGLPSESLKAGRYSVDDYDSLDHEYSLNAGRHYQHINYMVDVLNEYQDKIAIFETRGKDKNSYDELFRFYENVVSPNAMPFNFHLMHTPWDGAHLKQRVDTFQSWLTLERNPVYVLSNHDKLRFPARIGSDSVRVAAMLELTLPGIAMMYYGDEIGMAGVEIQPYQVLDPLGQSHPDEGRDGARSPMQWSQEDNAGFSKGTPWLPVAKDYKEKNVSLQNGDKGSVLELYKSLINMRKKQPALKYGSYVEVDSSDERVLEFERVCDEQRLRIVLNLSGDSVDLPELESSRVLLSTGNNDSETTPNLGPYTGLILEI